MVNEKKPTRKKWWLIDNQRLSKMQKTNDYDSSSDFVEGCNNNMSSDDNSDDNKEGNSNKIPPMVDYSTDEDTDYNCKNVKIINNNN